VGYASILLLAVGLAMDACAVAAARGLAAKTIERRDVLVVAGLFGGFQAFMPLLGTWLGRALGPLIAAWQHWAAFALLSGVGAKMLWEARDAGDRLEQADGLFALGPLLILAVATSIDAFAVGISLPMLGAPLALSLFTIGVTTALLSAAALLGAKRLGQAFGPRVEVLGGGVLLALGVKILLAGVAA
jgi:putative Mn2+ efflux pump MntP